MGAAVCKGVAVPVPGRADVRAPLGPAQAAVADADPQDEALVVVGAGSVLEAAQDALAVLVEPLELAAGVR